MPYLIRRPLKLCLQGAAIAITVCSAASAQTTGSGTPYQVSGECSIPAGSTQCEFGFKIPSGDIFVMQTASAYTDGSEGIQVLIYANYKGAQATFALTPIPTYSSSPVPGNTINFTGYAGDGHSLTIGIYGNSTAGGQIGVVTVSGYLIPSAAR